MRWLYLPVVSLAACASAGSGLGSLEDGPPSEQDGPPADAMEMPDMGPTPDAAPMPVTLSQNINTVPNGTRLGCNQVPGNFTRANSYYRVFTLADHSVPGSFEVKSVTFAVNLANAGGTSQPAQVKIGRYNATPGGLTLNLANIVPITAVSISIPDGATSVTAPISGVLPPGSHLIVELEIPDGLAAQNQFFIGTNAAGETKPAYIRAPICGTNAPTSMNYVGQQNDPPIPKTDVIMTVDGLRY